MDCHSHNRTGRTASVVAATVVATFAWLCLADAHNVSAQIAANPVWSGPPLTIRTVPQAYPPTVWIAPQRSPQPVWIVPAPAVTTYYPPTDAGLPLQAVVVEPPTDVHLRITITGSLLSTLLSREVTHSGSIRDCLMGANLYGDQFTVTRLGVDCQPCATHARLLLRLRGLVTDRTVGVTAPASIHSEGSHRFEMTKEVNFDGRQFTTRSPSAWVTPQIIYRGASTVVSGVPVIGQIGTAIALNEAERRRPAVEQFALRRVTRTAAPRFNNEVDKNLSDANRRLSRHVPALLKQLGLSTADQRLSTGSDRLYYSLRLPVLSRHERPIQGPRTGDQGSGTLPETWEAPHRPILPAPSASSGSRGPVFLESIEQDRTEADSPGDAPQGTGKTGGTKETTGTEPLGETHVPTFDAIAHQSTPSAPLSEPQQAMSFAPPTVEGRALTILIHEDFVNHLLSRLPLAGQEVPDRLIDRAIAALLDVLAGKSLKEMSIDWSDIPDPEFATLLLDQDRPLSIRFTDSRAVLTLRAGFRPLLGGEIATQRVEIPFQVSRQEHQITLEPQAVTVEPTSEEDSGPLAGLARPVVRQQVQQRLQSFSLKDTLPLSIPGMTATTLSVRDVVLEDGWLAITFD